MAERAADLGQGAGRMNRSPGLLGEKGSEAVHEAVPEGPEGLRIQVEGGEAGRAIGHGKEPSRSSILPHVISR
jgi:hypothetical protein